MVLVRSGTLAGGTVAFISAVTSASHGGLDVRLAGLALLGILLVNLMVFERTKAYRPAVAIVLGASSLFFLGVFLHTGAHPATVVWAYLFQTLPCVLAGRKVGALVVGAFDTVLISIILLQGGENSIIADRRFFTGLVVSLLVLAGVSILFEHVRKIAHDRLLVEVAERRRAEREARRASEKAARAAAAQARFLANMSHEIRTPMNGVIGVNELLLQGNLTDEQRDYAQTIDASARSLLTVLNDVLDLSKIESGHVSIEKAPLNLREVLNSLIALYQPEAGKKGLAMTLTVTREVPQCVEGDEQRLRQILANLLRNAVKFTEEGRVDLTVMRHNEAGGVRFEVRDTGIGLAPSQKNKIFEAFQQADSSTTRRYGGTGLGLSISKQLVQLMGGSIGADGRPGRGSVFWFAIDLPAVDPMTVERKVRPTSTTGAVVEGRRVLVVEDNPVNRKVVCRMLERLQLTVEMAEDGQIALDMWQNNRYSLVFMDVQMPRLDGYDTTRALRRREGVGTRTPIVALTANAMQGDRERCLAAGMDDYLSKPVIFEDLKRVVREWAGLMPVKAEPSLEPSRSPARPRAGRSDPAPTAVIPSTPSSEASVSSWTVP